jgi:hypothetical protein
MPVKIGVFEPYSDEEFESLRRRKGRAANPAMEDLLDAVESGQAVRVPLQEGQSARGLRAAISRAATARGLTVETLEGDGFVAVRKAEEPKARRGRQPATEGAARRRGRPRKDRAQEEAEIASQRDLAAGEA